MGALTHGDQVYLFKHLFKWYGEEHPYENIKAFYHGFSLGEYSQHHFRISDLSSCNDSVRSTPLIKISLELGEYLRGFFKNPLQSFLYTEKLYNPLSLGTVVIEAYFTDRELDLLQPLLCMDSLPENDLIGKKIRTYAIDSGIKVPLFEGVVCSQHLRICYVKITNPLSSPFIQEWTPDFEQVVKIDVKETEFEFLGEAGK